MEVRLADGSLVVIDAGRASAGSELSLANEEPRRIDILLSHLHLDHLEGLDSSPIWDPRYEIHVWGPASESASLRDRILTYFAAAVPHPHDIPARVSSTTRRPSRGNSGRSPSAPASSSTPGRRWDTGWRRTDTSPSPTTTPPRDRPGDDRAEKVSFGLALGADFLLHDSRYTEDEYPNRVGWGHSSIADTVLFAHMTKVHRLVMFHHDPLHSDLALEQLLLRARELWGSERDGLVLCAWEGMEFDVG
jgi:ribonuclease BN (tRNA processing enzyme)